MGRHRTSIYRVVAVALTVSAIYVLLTNRGGYSGISSGYADIRTHVRPTADDTTEETDIPDFDADAGDVPVPTGPYCPDKTVDDEAGRPNPMNKTLPSWKELEDQVDCLPGGEWTPDSDKISLPADCSMPSVAIIVPYRDRDSHLRVFLRHIHEYCQRQTIHYRIFVVEQTPGQTFNRGKLINVGFKEAQKYGRFDCFIMHDVDLMPVVLGLPYRCNNAGPSHLIASMDKFKWGLPYNAYFGGVTAFTREQYKRANGMTNRFWGWGGEDDDLYKRFVQDKSITLISVRLELSGQKFQRVPVVVGKYSMFKHGRDAGNSPKHGDHMKLLRKTRIKWRKDGLRDLEYELIGDRAKIEKTYTLITVDLLEDTFIEKNKL